MKKVIKKKLPLSYSSIDYVGKIYYAIFSNLIYIYLCTAHNSQIKMNVIIKLTR